FEFILGVSIAYSVLHLRTGAPALGAVLVLAGAAFTFGLAWDSGSARLAPWGIGAAVIVLGTVWLEPLIRSARLASPLAFLGDASYSIYLSHTFVVPACVLLFRRVGLTDPTAIVLLVSGMVMLAGSLSHVWLEKPMTSFFKRVFVRTAPLRYRNARPAAPE
ncbi:MAG TPA: acyltransferase family protein, partial [Ramlibacter sp.]|nr:acyltransferase family protein [Ramlibacter sp.]